MVRIVFCSDTHGKHHSISVPDGDILIHCGDILLRYGYHDDSGGGGHGRVRFDVLHHFDEWMVTLSHAVKLTVAGNLYAVLEGD